jgi:hypothetical protein
MLFLALHRIQYVVRVNVFWIQGQAVLSMKPRSSLFIDDDKVHFLE